MLKIKNCRWIFLIWEQTSSFGTYKSVNLEYNTLVCWADGTNQEFIREGETETAMILYKLNKSL